MNLLIIYIYQSIASVVDGQSYQCFYSHRDLPCTKPNFYTNIVYMSSSIGDVSNF